MRSYNSTSGGHSCKSLTSQRKPSSQRKIKYTKMDAGLARYFRDNAARQLRKANSKVDVDQLGY